MKISMWIIGETLSKYRPELHITEGIARITGIRYLLNPAETVLEPQFVYLKQTNTDSGQVELINGTDRIILGDQNVNLILNTLLESFEFFNNWESALWEAAARHAIQEIVDLGTEILGNPINVSDSEGNILAMSSIYQNEYINAHWDEIRKTNRIPMELLGSPLRTIGGSLSDWSESPECFLLPNGDAIMGVNLCINGERIAAIGIPQHRKTFSPGDKDLTCVLRDVLLSFLGAASGNDAIRSGASIITDLLAGVQIDPELLDKLALNCNAPWRFLVIDNPFRSDLIYKQNLLKRLQTAPFPCIPFLFDEHIVTLLSDCDVDKLDSLFARQDMMYYQASLSLPFDSLRSAPIQYDLALYSIGSGKGSPGLYPSEDHALDYLLLNITELVKYKNFIHPALRQLQSVDAKKNSQLYETLYQYLLHERSIRHGADAMHVHKNSFLYRLQRIREITGLNLDEPMVRVYLLLCYLLESHS